jgi:hypothetical protein
MLPAIHSLLPDFVSPRLKSNFSRRQRQLRCLDSKFAAYLRLFATSRAREDFVFDQALA